MAKDTNNMLSAVVITKNEEKRIAKCLESLLPIADEIIVMDSYSTDKTKEICESYPVVFLQQAWEGYAQTKNKANALAKFDWILSLDADEELSEALQKSILEAKKGAHRIYKIGRITNYCGKWIKHCGWYPDTKIRLFDRRFAKWEGDFVHERLVLQTDAQAPLLAGHCYHYSYDSVAKHIEKANHFSSLAASEKFMKGKRFSFGGIIFSPISKFLGTYLIKQGFRDGTYGFIISVLSAYERFMRQAKLYQMGKQEKQK